MDADAVVELAGELPDIVLKEYRHWTSITFRGKGFAWVDHEADKAMVKSTHEEREACVATNPGVYGEGWESRTTAWISIRLDRADPEEIYELLAEGWRMTSTKKAISEFDAAHGLT